MTAAHSIAPHTSRRTFAIISHPDAGKTTLTERLLLAGGAIRAAGDVKARGERRRARSDWMEIEQKRGISVTSSVMTFEKDGITFNLLDTPGHSDFSEDTYRTRTAVDAARLDVAGGADRPAGQQQPLGQRGLAGVRVGDDRECTPRSMRRDGMRCGHGPPGVFLNGWNGCFR